MDDATNAVLALFEKESLFLIFIFVLSATASYFTKIYNKSRSFSFLDFTAVNLVGLLCGIVFIYIGDYFGLTRNTNVILASVFGTMSMSIITRINANEGDILKFVFKKIFK